MNYITLYSLILISLLTSFSSCTNSIQKPDVIVIGGGLMGSSVAWQLSSMGVDVVLYERQDTIYENGSSYGDARIARSNNRGHDRWSYLHNETVSEIEKLILFLNETDTENDYDISDIYTTSPVSYLGRIQIYDRLLASIKRQNVIYRMATNPEEGSRMFGVQLPDSVLLQREYNLHSGTINPRQLISYLHRAISLKGGMVIYNRSVSQVKRGDKGFVLNYTDLKSGKKGQINSAKVISAVGPHTGKLLHDIAPYFERLITPKRVFLAFLKLRKSVWESFSEEEERQFKSGYPVINSSKGTRMGSFFSMIEYYDDGVPVIKIGGHFQRTDIGNLDEVWKQPLSQSEQQWSIDNTVNYLNLLNLSIRSEDLIYDHGYSCVYSLTENEIPLITPIRDLNNQPDTSFIVMGGMSGVGAKGCLTYGKLAAKILTGTNSEQQEESNLLKDLGIDRLPNITPER